MMRVAFHQRIRHDPNFAHVIRIADVVHITLRGGQPRAVLRNDIDAWMGTMQPDGSRQTWNVQNHADSGCLHLVHDAVEPFKGKLALRGLKRIPREVAHAHNVESRVLHDRDILIDLLRRTIDRLIAGAHKKLAWTRPIGMSGCGLSSRY